MVQGNKLRTYLLLKNYIDLENYLLFENCKTINEFIKFRISVHDLKIEKGRHKGMHSLGYIEIVEDEIHFLLQCPSLTTERFSFISDILSNITNFKSLDDKSKSIWLVLNNDLIVNTIAIQLLNTLIKTRRGTVN